MSNSNRIRHVDTSVVIAGIEFPVLNWSVTLASQGNMGTGSAEGSLSDLIDSGLDIISVSQDPDGASFDIFAGYDGDSRLIFSGVVDSCDLFWDDNKFEIRGRDHSASFLDGRQTVAKLQYRNQTVAKIVQQIADEFGFQTDITDPGIMAGPEMNGEHSFNPHPQSYWSLLQGLAESVGYECYMTPDQTLYFGPEKQRGSFTVNYGAEPGSDAANPAWGLEVSYNPRNNSNIEVKALSINPQSTQVVTASAHATQVATGRGRKTTSSLLGQAKTRASSKGRSGSKGKKKTTYYIRCAGLTPAQAKARCQSMADNLAKHQIIVRCNVEGLPDLAVHSQITIVQDTIDLYGFAGIPLNVAEVSHAFTTPSNGDSSGGFTTSFRALAQVED